MTRWTKLNNINFYCIYFSKTKNRAFFGAFLTLKCRNYNENNNTLSIKYLGYYWIYFIEIFNKEEDKRTLHHGQIELIRAIIYINSAT